jgi:hypothetical protein
MERMFPKMQIVELDGSHWIHVDQPEGVFRTMYFTLSTSVSVAGMANFRSSFVQELK